jgi:hypothetical protein
MKFQDMQKWQKGILMRPINKQINFYAILSFLFGLLICYISTQYKYFNINTEVNVIGCILSVLTIFVGIWIAIAIPKSQNRAKGVYDTVQNDLMYAFKDYLALKGKLSIDTNITVAEANSLFKKLFKK